MTTKLYTWICRLHNDLRGQDMVEYALMAGFVAVAGGAMFPTTIMPGVSAIFSKLNIYTASAASQGN
jgi:Flp pilus assembly pilin Flp